MITAGKLGLLVLSSLFAAWWVFGMVIGLALEGPLEDADFALMRTVVLLGLPIPMPIGVLLLLFSGKPRHQASTRADRLAGILGWVFFALPLPFIFIFFVAPGILMSRLMPGY